MFAQTAGVIKSITSNFQTDNYASAKSKNKILKTNKN